MVLETAIGMAFVFLLVSLLVTATSEMIANALGLRARCLRKGLHIFQHLLVAGGVAPTAEGSGPSYIPTQVSVRQTGKRPETNPTPAS